MEEINGKADIIRWEILYEYGGVFVDADSICIEPIDDHLINTKGLIGPEYQSSDNENMGDQRFIGLCRSTGKNSTSEGQDSTGSWGYGKSVIWREVSLKNKRLKLKL